MNLEIEETEACRIHGLWYEQSKGCHICKQLQKQEAEDFKQYQIDCAKLNRKEV